MTHLVMFDIDGTLVDSTGFDTDLYAQALREVLGVELDETRGNYRHVTDSGILGQILEERRFDSPADELRARVKRRFIELNHGYVESNPSVVREIAGAKAMIAALRALPGVRLAIATGGWRETALLKLQMAGLAIEGIAVATASDAAERARIMQIAERRAMGGSAAGRRTYFGDGAWDKRASTELGYAFIAIGRDVEHEVCFDDFSDREAVLASLGHL